eukprot:CAMPEP_0178896440 /NCGR_PEP_ID=MMETSP0786-20121207/1173_1 /TAXON_ID=186022 /ORGANISM="Thalassionema frauenfeldii, Strain CCMP 1798" /LENGTH=1085 /DNA_ID=CAMNT_0020566841 /DNA_START=33 /DNA_END=3290 /DNA_ORIENTATION=-
MMKRISSSGTITSPDDPLPPLSNFDELQNNIEDMDAKSSSEVRERLGFCTTCPGAPIKLFEITPKTNNNNFRSRFPIDRRHDSYQGICLKCHPQLDPNIHSTNVRSAKRLGGAASRRRDQHQSQVSHHWQLQQHQQQQIQNNENYDTNHQQMRYPPIRPPPAFHHDSRRYILNSKQHQRLMQQPEYAPSIQSPPRNFDEQKILEQHMLQNGVPQEVLLNEDGENDSMTSIGLGSINTPAAGGGEYYYHHPQTNYQYQSSPLPYGPFSDYPPPPSMKSYFVPHDSSESTSGVKPKKKKKKKKKSSRKKSSKSSKSKDSKAKNDGTEAEAFSDPDFSNEKEADAPESLLSQGNQQSKKIKGRTPVSFPSMQSLTESQADKMWATNFHENNEDWEAQDEEEEDDEESTDDIAKGTFSIVLSDSSSLKKGGTSPKNSHSQGQTSTTTKSASSGTTATCDKKPAAVESVESVVSVTEQENVLNSRDPQQVSNVFPERASTDIVASVSVIRSNEGKDSEINAAAVAAENSGEQDSQRQVTPEQQQKRQVDDQRLLLEDVKAAAIESNQIEIFLDLLVTTLQEECTTQAIVALCLRHVWDCAKNIDGCKTKIMDCRLDVHIKHALEKHLDDKQVQHYGCRCIWSLSVDPVCRKSMIQAGAIQWIYNTMEDYKDDKYVLESAFGALRTMSSSCGTAFQASHRQQFLDSSHSENSNSTSSPARVLLLPLDALRPSVCRIMGLHSSSIPIQRDGCAFLSNVAVDMEQQVVSVVSKDEITTVVQALSMYGAPDVWGCACFCLKNYTYEDRNLRVLLKLYDPYVLDLLDSIITSIDQFVTNPSILQQIREDANQIRSRLELFKTEEQEMENIRYSSLVDAMQDMTLDEAVTTILDDVLNNPENELSTKLICFGISKLHDLSCTNSDNGTNSNNNETDDEESEDTDRDESPAERSPNFYFVVSNPLVWKAVLATMEDQPSNFEIQKAGCGAIQFWMDQGVNMSERKLLQFDLVYAFEIVSTAANLHDDVLIRETFKKMNIMYSLSFSNTLLEEVEENELEDDAENDGSLLEEVEENELEDNSENDASASEGSLDKGTG